MHRVRHLIRKELLELKRDPRLFSIVVMAPIVQLLVLGYAATTDVKDIPIVIVDADRSTASRDLVRRFETSQNFKIVDMLGSTGDIDPFLDGGEVDHGQELAQLLPLHRGLGVGQMTQEALPIHRPKGFHFYQVR